VVGIEPLTYGLQICCRLFVSVRRQSTVPYFLGREGSSVRPCSSVVAGAGVKCGVKGGKAIEHSNFVWYSSRGAGHAAPDVAGYDAERRPRRTVVTTSRNARGRWDRNRTCTLRFWSPGFVNFWAFMRCRCMSPLGIVRGRIGRQVSLSVGLVRSCRGQL
jgi:hypothetical protein